MNLFIKHFPYITHSTLKHYANIAILGIGGNVGYCLRTFEKLFHFLQNNLNIRIYSTSPIYRNPPFGYNKQADFYNATIILSTTLCLRHLFAFIFYLERKFGRSRMREFKNSPRTLDIDLLFFSNKYVNFQHLVLPHIDYQNRSSVLIPLYSQLGLTK